MQRRSVKNNITQRLNSGSYNFTRNFRRNEKYLLEKIDEYQKYGTNMPGYIKQRLQQSQELLGRLRSSAASGAAAPAPLAAAATGVATGLATGPAPLVAPANDFLEFAEPGGGGGGGGGGGSVWVPRAAVANAPKRTLDIELNTWIPWEAYPNDVPFESPLKGIGNGEHKLAEILGITPNGQNKKYDLDMCLNVKGRDLCTKGEVKEIKKDSSFFPGANGRNEFRKTKHLIANLQEIFNRLFNDYKDMLSAKIVEYMSCYKERKDGSVSKNDLLTMTPDEISQTNLPRLIETCKYLNLQRQRIISSNNYKKLFRIHDVLSGELRDVNSSRLYKILSADSKSPEEITAVLGEQAYRLEQFLELIDHPIINNPEEFIRYLGQFAAKLFSDYTLILVNKKKGFYITDNLEARITIYRVTRAYPKFLITFSGKWDDIKISEADDQEEPPEES